jgi:hypothetical protein
VPSALAGERLSVMEDETVLEASYLYAVDRIWKRRYGRRIAE